MHALGLIFIGRLGLHALGLIFIGRLGLLEGAVGLIVLLGIACRGLVGFCRLGLRLGCGRRLDDGRVVRWTERVRPEEIEDADLPDLDRDGARAGLAVRRRAEVGLRPFDSPWSGWRVTLEEDAYRVRPAAEDAGGYAVRRDGDWSFLAWEAPTPGAPAGRLWISDGAGIAAYGPSGP
jgi:hypothetical protein